MNLIEVYVSRSMNLIEVYVRRSGLRRYKNKIKNDIRPPIKDTPFGFPEKLVRTLIFFDRINAENKFTKKKIIIYFSIPDNFRHDTKT